MRESFSRSAFFACAGLLIWAADFLFVYVFTALACERGFGHTVPWASAAAGVVSAAGAVAVILAGVRGNTFIGRLAASVAALALVAIGFIALPGLLLPRAC